MSKHMQKSLVVALVVLAAWLTPLSAAASPGKFAVLISTGRTTADDTWYHSEYWYDMMLTYRMLVELGFDHDHIYVLYGNGVDFVSAHAFYQNPYPNPITDYACTRANIQNIFNWLATGNPAEGIPALTTDDFLFVWWMGHGSGDASCNTTFSVSTTGEHVTDAELATWSGAVAHRRRGFVFMTCHSGGAMDDLQSNTTVTMPSCTCAQGSASAMYDVVHGEWTYWVDGALREVLPTGGAVASDTDGNNLVSLQETFDWGSTQPMASTPQLSDVGGIAPCVFMRLEEPGEDIEIFSKDHVNDDATVPSSYEVWYHGPDLWVRHAQDAGTAHQDPEYGQTNYVYGNVHNIGCASANNVSVEFSWVEPSGWCNPAMWNTIGTATIPALAVLNTETVNVPWMPPLPGIYCVHTRLNVTGDPENADGRAYLDDNKVQINVTVVDLWAGVPTKRFFFIENGGKDAVPIDLTFDRLAMPADAAVLVELPPELPFEGTKGIEESRTEDKWTVLKIPPGVKEAAKVEGVSLKPGEKHRAIVTLTLPPEVSEVRRKKAVFLFEERVKDEVVGGIRFVARTAEPKTVMCDLVRKKVNVFHGLAKEFGIDRAEKVARICKEMVVSGQCGDEKGFISGMTEIAGPERAIGKKLRDKDPRYGERYFMASEKLLKAIETGKLPAIVEAQQDVLLYASIILTDALTR